MAAGRFAIGSLLFLAAFAGCTDGSSGGLSASPSTSAPAPTVDVSTGAISGTVVDEEVKPVAKAVVALAETLAETETDAEGRFTFNELEPGAYRILAQRLGYESAGIKVDVIAGEVAEAKLVLKSIIIDAEGYVLVQPRVALIHVGLTTLSAVQNESAIQSLACDPCRLPIHLTKNPDAILAEGKWEDGPTPVLNAGLNVWYHKDWSGDGTGTAICYWQPSASPYRIEWSETCVKNAQKEDVILMHIQPGPVPGILAFEMKVETWTSFFYNLAIDEAYTALPPA